jgi:hypothetical protein
MTHALPPPSGVIALFYSCFDVGAAIGIPAAPEHSVSVLFSLEQVGASTAHGTVGPRARAAPLAAGYELAVAHHANVALPAFGPSVLVDCLRAARRAARFAFSFDSRLTAMQFVLHRYQSTCCLLILYFPFVNFW